MSELPTPSELLRAYGRPAKKRFGQNFLTDPTILDRIVDVAGVEQGTRVLEVGPGPGGLTTRLLAAGADVVAVEQDRDLVGHLRSAFPATATLRVVEGDALEPVLFDALGRPPRRVVANLPYNIATPILMRLVEAEDPPPVMALMFQLEVAQRIVAVGGTRQFGPLAIATQMTYRTEIAMRLKPGAFHPAPKVDSAVVRLERLARPLVEPELQSAVRHIARTAFMMRRKMLRKSLRSLADDPIAWLEAAGVEPTARPDELTIDDYRTLARSRPEG